jgi:hypothetical protein
MGLINLAKAGVFSAGAPVNLLSGPIFLSVFWKCPMKPNIIKPIVFFLCMTSMLALGGCSRSTATSCVERDNGSVAMGKGPRKIYVPAYYSYRNGKYQFVKGHYRWVVNRRLYLARAYRGYTSKMDDPAAR